MQLQLTAILFLEPLLYCNSQVARVITIPEVNSDSLKAMHEMMETETLWIIITKLVVHHTNNE